MPLFRRCFYASDSPPFRSVNPPGWSPDQHTMRSGGLVRGLQLYAKKVRTIKHDHYTMLRSRCWQNEMNLYNKRSSSPHMKRRFQCGAWSRLRLHEAMEKKTREPHTTPIYTYMSTTYTRTYQHNQHAIIRRVCPPAAPVGSNQNLSHLTNGIKRKYQND